MSCGEENFTEVFSFPKNDEVRDASRQICPEAEVGAAIFPNCPSYITSTKEQTQIFSRDGKEKTMVQTSNGNQSEVSGKYIFNS